VAKDDTDRPPSFLYAHCQTNLPEYLIDVNHIYRFTYDQDYNAIEDEFSTNARPGGDVDANGTLYRFFGEINTRGLGPGDRHVPANLPYLTNTIQFELSDTAVDDILRYEPEGYPTKRKHVCKLLEAIPKDMVVEFDFDQIGGSTEVGVVLRRY
jgi:hypothetical protein